MSSGIAFLQIGRRWLTAGSALITAACALNGADPRRADNAALPELDVPPAPTASYIVQTSSFSLVAQSKVARDHSVRALRTTAGAFYSLLGDDPPLIGVVVIDTSAYGRQGLAMMPSADLATVTLTGGVLAGPDSARSAASLNSELRFLAANTWLSEYGMLWSTALDAQGIVFMTRQGQPVPHARSFPDWLHVAVLCVLTGDDVRADRVLANDVPVLPIRTLFSYQLRSWQARLLEARMRAPSGGEPDANAGSAAVHDTRFLDGFIRQSTSVLLYLRASQGDEGLSNMLGAMVAGLDSDEILARLPHPTTLEALDRDWRAWMTRVSDSGATPLSSRNP